MRVTEINAAPTVSAKIDEKSHRKVAFFFVGWADE